MTHPPSSTPAMAQVLRELDIALRKSARRLMDLGSPTDNFISQAFILLADNLDRRKPIPANQKTDIWGVVAKAVGEALNNADGRVSALHLEHEFRLLNISVYWPEETELEAPRDRAAALTGPPSPPPPPAVACKANSGVGGNDPQECDWPACGCDWYANKVIAALDDAGALKSQAAPPLPKQEAGAWDAEAFVAERWGVSSQMICNFGDIVDAVKAARADGFAAGQKTVMERLAKVTDGLADMQRHRDHWRDFALGKRKDQPGNYLGDEPPLLRAHLAAGKDTGGGG